MSKRGKPWAWQPVYEFYMANLGKYNFPYKNADGLKRRMIYTGHIERGEFPSNETILKFIDDENKARAVNWRKKNGQKRAAQISGKVKTYGFLPDREKMLDDVMKRCEKRHKWQRGYLVRYA